MKKILLIIAISFLLFQMIVLATAIDIGSEAINRPDTTAQVFSTHIDKNNPANESGIITEVKFYVANAIEGCYVIIFEKVGTHDFTARDSVSLGNFGTGLQTEVVDLDVVAGDYIGIYYSNIGGDLDLTESGDGMWYAGGNQFECDDHTFTFVDNRTLSLEGTGETVVTFPLAAWSTKVIVKWNTKEITKWNTIE